MTCGTARVERPSRQKTLSERESSNVGKAFYLRTEQYSWAILWEPRDYDVFRNNLSDYMIAGEPPREESDYPILVTAVKPAPGLKPIAFFVDLKEVLSQVPEDPKHDFCQTIPALTAQIARAAAEMAERHQGKAPPTTEERLTAVEEKVSWMQAHLKVLMKGD